MLINGKRELAYGAIIEEIIPIEGYDRVEYARVNGWWVIVRKGQFQVGDLAVYLEIDSKVPEVEPFLFLEQRHFRVKTLKMCKVISQGLLMSAEDFGWTVGYEQFAGNVPYFDINGKHYPVGTGLTEILGITYADAEDNKRKADSEDKYKKMAQRKPNIFKKPWAKWLMKREWGRKFMFALFGRKKDKKGGWPDWVKKTDEERVQNMPLVLTGDESWVVTEKVDGSSATYTIHRTKKKNKFDFYVCSRNVVQTTPDRPCFYDTNIYWEIAKKYDIQTKLTEMLQKNPSLDYIILQGEVYGNKVQKREYGLKDHDFAAFNLIIGTDKEGQTRWSSITMKEILGDMGIPCVPIIDKDFKTPKTVEEMLTYAAGVSQIDGGMREGVVLRSLDGTRSFKAVDNGFLLKYHQ